MNKKILYMSVLFCMMVCFVLGTEKKSKAAEGDVAINATNFPDAYLRKALQKKDLNSDGVMSKQEIEKVKKIKISSLNEKTQKCSPINIKGIDIFLIYRVFI